METENQEPTIVSKIGEYISNNEKYARLENFEKLDLIDLFYNHAFYSEQFHLLTVVATENREETSELLIDLIEDDRFKKLDAIDVDPKYQNEYISFDNITKNIFNALVGASDELLTEEKVVRIMSPLKAAIEIGGLDTQTQQDNLNTNLKNLEVGINISDKIRNGKDVQNYITKFIDDAFYARDELLERKEPIIIERIIKEQGYVQKFPFETIQSIRKNIVQSYSEKEMTKIAKMINLTPSRGDGNILVELLKNNAKFAQILNKEDLSLKPKKLKM